VFKRIYVDNYKCLVNFELSVGGLNLFLGPNGAGKSAVFEVLRMLGDRTPPGRTQGAGET